jgi:hypothetical protein
MNVYICKRGRDMWEGALLIAAADEAEAARLFRMQEAEEPTRVRLLDDKVVATGEPRVLYDDDMR